MFYLSNRKLRLLIISLLLLIFAFLLGIFNVKAQVYSCNIGTNNTTPRSIELPTTSPAQAQWVQTCSSFDNKGSGYVYFIVKATPNKQNVPINRFLNLIEIGTTNSWRYQCEYGTFNGYIDNQNSSTIYSVKCPVNNFDGDSGSFNKITLGDSGYFNSNGNQGLYLDIGPYIMFVTESDTDIINAMNSNTQAIINAFSSNNQTQNDIKNNTDDIKNSINDSSIDSSGASSSASTWNSKNTTNGTITNLLTLPITLLQAIVNGLQTSCSSFSLGTLFGTNITLPCINVGNLIGSGLWTTIDILFSGFMILAIAKKLIKIFNDFTNLKSNQIDELYGGGNK